MSFYYLSKEMGLALNDILGRACSYNKDFSREDISITWINYKSENKSVFKGFGTGINNKKMVYPASIVKLVYGLAAYYWIKKGSLFLSDEVIDATIEGVEKGIDDSTTPMGLIKSSPWGLLFLALLSLLTSAFIKKNREISDRVN